MAAFDQLQAWLRQNCVSDAAVEGSHSPWNCFPVRVASWGRSLMVEAMVWRSRRGDEGRLRGKGAWGG